MTPNNNYPLYGPFWHWLSNGCFFFKKKWFRKNCIYNKSCVETKRTWSSLKTILVISSLLWFGFHIIKIRKSPPWYDTKFSTVSHSTLSFLYFYIWDIISFRVTPKIVFSLRLRTSVIRSEFELSLSLEQYEYVDSTECQCP